MNNTNFFDVMAIFLYFTFLLSVFGGTAYLVQVHDWSPWWFTMALLIASVKMKTGC